MWWLDKQKTPPLPSSTLPNHHGDALAVSLFRRLRMHDSMRDGDVVLSIEYCNKCSSHNDFGNNHDEALYKQVSTCFVSYFQ